MFLYCIFHVKKLKLKQVVYHKNIFPSDENSFLKGKVRNLFYRTYFNFNGKKLIVKHRFLNNCWHKAGHCIYSSFPSLLYFTKQEAQWSLSTSGFSCQQLITSLPFAYHCVKKDFSSSPRYNITSHRLLARLLVLGALDRHSIFIQR